MAQLTVRNIPDDVVRALRIRAARNGRSAESEHRMILARALTADSTGFWSQADALRGRSRKQRFDSADIQRKMRHER